MDDPSLETVPRKEVGDGLGLVMADLHRRQTAGIEQLRQLRRKRPIGVEAAFAREQRLVGLELAHAGAKLRTFRDIGRVAEDQVEALRYSFSPIPELKLQPCFEAEAASVGRSVGQSATRDVDADPGRAGPDV